MKPPRGLLVGDRAGRREWDRIVAALEARRLPLPNARWLAAMRDQRTAAERQVLLGLFLQTSAQEGAA